MLFISNCQLNNYSRVTKLRIINKQHMFCPFFSADVTILTLAVRERSTHWLSPF